VIAGNGGPLDEHARTLAERVLGVHS
jgi:hypothetical protein